MSRVGGGMPLAIDTGAASQGCEMRGFVANSVKLYEHVRGKAPRYEYDCDETVRTCKPVGHVYR